MRFAMVSYERVCLCVCMYVCDIIFINAPGWTWHSVFCSTCRIFLSMLLAPSTAYSCEFQIELCSRTGHPHKKQIATLVGLLAGRNPNSVRYGVLANADKSFSRTAFRVSSPPSNRLAFAIVEHVSIRVRVRDWRSTEPPISTAPAAIRSACWAISLAYRSYRICRDCNTPKWWTKSKRSNRDCGWVFSWCLFGLNVDVRIIVAKCPMQSDSDYGGHNFNHAMHGSAVPIDQQPYGSMQPSMNNDHNMSDPANIPNAQNAIASGNNNNGQTNGFSFTPPTVPSTKDGEIQDILLCKMMPVSTVLNEVFFCVSPNLSQVMLAQTRRRPAKPPTRRSRTTAGASKSSSSKWDRWEWLPLYY